MAVTQRIDLRQAQTLVMTPQLQQAIKLLELSNQDLVAYVETELEQIFYYESVAFDPACVAAVRAAADRFGYSHRDIVSGAGHDACYLAQVAPTSMVFVPCVDGISHNEIEDATPAWIESGANVLLHAMLSRACEPAS